MQRTLEGACIIRLSIALEIFQHAAWPRVDAVSLSMLQQRNAKQ